MPASRLLLPLTVQGPQPQGCYTSPSCQVRCLGVSAWTSMGVSYTASLDSQGEGAGEAEAWHLLI